MNINDCGKILMTYFSPEERTIPDAVAYPGRNAAVIKAMNHALQEMFGKGKPWVRHDERGAVLNPPTAVTIAVTKGSNAGTITGWQTWMAGCTIVIDGATVDNQIRNNTSAVRLKFPFSGATGTRNAMVYHDSVTVDIDVLEIHLPVMLNGREIAPMANPQSFVAVRSNEDFGFQPGIAVQTGVRASAGLPVGYAIDTWSPDGKTQPQLRIRLFPAPEAEHFLGYPVMLCPPKVTDLTSTDTLPIPFDFTESIFLPRAVAALRQCPFWRGIAGEDAVNSAASDAQDAIADADPNKTAAPTLRAIF